MSVSHDLGLSIQCGHLEIVVDSQAKEIAELESSISVLTREVAAKNAELSRKQAVIESQLVRIEHLDNQLQNRLSDISVLEDTISDRDTVRKSVKFNAVHLLQSALAVLNGL